MKIENSTAGDIDSIFALYDIATAYMKERSPIAWPAFERSMVQTEIEENRQWKMIINNSIACVWATTFSDEQIWEEKNADAAVYIHRIAVHPDFRGQQLVSKIVAWAMAHAKEHHKKYVRLDTVGDNKGLIKHYTSCGFDFLGLYQLKNTTGLPPHYHNATVSLFELTAQQQ